MAAPFIPPQAIENLRMEANKRGLMVWIDREARLAGYAFIWLRRKGSTLAEFWDVEDALAWMGAKQ